MRNTPLTIVGHTNYAIPLEDQRAAYERMTAHAAAGELTADVERVGLGRRGVGVGAAALRPRAKLVVVP